MVFFMVTQWQVVICVYGCVHERMIITRREVSIFSTSLIGSTKYVRKSNLKNVWVKGWAITYWTFNYSTIGSESFKSDSYIKLSKEGLTQASNFWLFCKIKLAKYCKNVWEYVQLKSLAMAILAGAAITSLFG